MTERRRAGGIALVVVAIVLLAFSARSAVASLSPLFTIISQEMPLPSVVIGLIGIAPPLCYAVFGIVTPAFEGRMGLERLAWISALVMAAGTLARSAAGSGLWLFASTLLIFAAVGVANVILPALVKRYCPHRIAAVTMLYSMTMSAATMLPPLFAVPLAGALGWRGELAIWAVFAAAATIPWLRFAMRRTRPVDVEHEPPARRPGAISRMWGIPAAWGMVVTFFSSGASGYISFAWMPLVLTERAGVSPAAASALLSIVAAIGIPLALIVPIVVQRWPRSVLPLYAVSGLSGFAGAMGLLLAPAFAPWLWVTGIGVATLPFVLTLLMLNLRTRTHEGVVALSGMVQAVGYGLAAATPLLFGILHDLFGVWDGSLWLLGCCALTAIPAGLIVARESVVEDEWERRTGRRW